MKLTRAGDQGCQANKHGLRGPSQRASGNTRGMAPTGNQQVVHSAPRSHQCSSTGGPTSGYRQIRAGIQALTLRRVLGLPTPGISRQSSWRWLLSLHYPITTLSLGGRRVKTRHRRPVAQRFTHLTGPVPLIQLWASRSQVGSLSHSIPRADNLHWLKEESGPLRRKKLRIKSREAGPCIVKMCRNVVITSVDGRHSSAL